MDFTSVRYSVRKLVDAWNGGSLAPNKEYQRGEAWTKEQKQALIDSILRKYPIPPLFLEKKTKPGLDGVETSQWEIVDGQQRTRALADFLADNFPLLDPQDRKLRLPNSMRSKAVEWAKCTFSQLIPQRQTELENANLDVYEICNVAQSDEVRDLFIRLQSGTALTRQQIRDAWPGNLGPYIERLAGKLDKSPRYTFLQLVDRRGAKDEETDVKDRYVTHRQTCAQLLRILLARHLDPTSAAPSVAASDLDSFYHEYTNFDVKGQPAKAVENILQQLEETADSIKKDKGRTKVPKLGLFALAMYLQDVAKDPLRKPNLWALGGFAVEGAPRPYSRSTSGHQIQKYYEEWQAKVRPLIETKLDPRRDFDDQQKAIIRERQGGKCAVCGDYVEEAEAEFDHHPVAYRNGGRTELENGRLVHTSCHARGRPKTDAGP